MSKEITKLVATIVIDYSEKSQRALQNLKWDMKNVQDSSSKVTDQINKLNQRLADMAKNNKAATAFGKVSNKLANISVNAKTAQKQLKAVNRQLRNSGSFGSGTGKPVAGKKNPTVDRKQLGLVDALTKKIARWRVVLGLALFAVNAVVKPIMAVIRSGTLLLRTTSAISAGITALTLKMTSLTKATYDTARATGVSTKFLKSWRTVVVDAGVASESAMDTLEEFRTSLGDALQDPKSDVAQAFREAGTSAEELQDILSKQGTEKSFGTLMNLLQRMSKEGSEIAAQQLGDRILKGEGAKIVTSLGKRKEAYLELIKTRKQLSLLTEDQETKSVEFANLWYQVSASIASGFQQLASGTAEQLLPDIKRLIGFIKTNAEEISYVLTLAGKALTVALLYALVIAGKLSATFIEMAKSFLGLDKNSTFSETMKKAYEWADKINTTLTGLVPIMEQLGNLADVLMKTVNFTVKAHDLYETYHPVGMVGKAARNAVYPDADTRAKAKEELDMKQKEWVKKDMERKAMETYNTHNTKSVSGDTYTVNGGMNMTVSPHQEPIIQDIVIENLKTKGI